MNIFDAMELRKSVRSYRKEPVEERVITHLKDSLSQSQSALRKGCVRYEILTGYSKEVKTGFLYGMGKITAPAMIVGICEEKEDFVEIGFCLEKEVLYLTQEGYGSCFLGTYDEKVLRSQLKLSEKEQISIVLVFGKPDKESWFMNGTFRNIAGSTRRKSFRDILLNAEEFDEQDTIVDVVKHAIMAPSGNNVQPVRVMVHDNRAIFYLKDKHYLTDLGIFIAHFYLCCLEIYDNVEMTNIEKEPEPVNGMEPMITICWKERKTCH